MVQSQSIVRRILSVICSVVFLLFTVTNSFAQVSSDVSEDTDMMSSVSSPDEGSENFMVSGTSDRITLELKGVDIIDVLKVLAKKSGLNIVAGKNVRGQVTLFLQNVDVKEALKVVLETSELAYEEENGIIKVTTMRDYEAMYGKPYADKRKTEVLTLKYADAQTVSQFLAELKTTIGKIVVDDRSNSLTLVDLPETVDAMKQAIETIDVPLTTKVFSLKYGTVEDVQASITETLTPTIGQIKVDKRTNKIAIIDYPEKIRYIEEIIQAFDEKPPQVLIEAKIVQVLLDDDYAFGIDWSAVMEKTRKEKVALDANGYGGFASSPFTSTTLPSFTMNTSNDDFYAVITALEGMGKTNTLSSPRLSVLNGEEAKISVATKKPYVSQTVVQGDTTSTTADNIQFVDVGVIMTVKPKITNDNMVVLKIKPEVSSSTSDFTLEELDSDGNVTGTRTSVPIVTQQLVETTVLVESGKTLVLGGLIQDTESKLSRKIPVVGDIPLIGRAFRNETVDNTKTELVIFLSPNIVQGTRSEAATNKEEYAKYLDERGRLAAFDKVGSKDYDFTKTYKNSMSPFNDRERPFWQQRNDTIDSAVNTVAFKKEAYSSIMAEREPSTAVTNVPRSTGTSQYEASVDRTRETGSSTTTAVTMSAQSPEDADATYLVAKQQYAVILATRINQALSKSRDLEPYHGNRSTIALIVRNDGMVESMGFSKQTPFNEDAVRDSVRQIIERNMPFPQFSDSSFASTERFEIEISL